MVYFVKEVICLNAHYAVYFGDLWVNEVCV